MSKISAFLKVDGKHVTDCVRAAHAKLDGSPVKTVLDFSSVLRIDPKDLIAMEELARLADEKAVEVGLRGVNVEVYKVLKLVNLTSRLRFLG
jgi:ABC-type transporter Mla MlaB component